MIKILAKKSLYALCFALVLGSSNAMATGSAWSVGVQGAHLQCAASFRTSSLNVAPGVNVGYHFNDLVALELSASIGTTTMTSHTCCSNYWLGVDGVRYNTAVLGKDGMLYGDLESRVSLQKYQLSAPINLLSFLHTSTPMSLTVAPSLAVVNSKAQINYDAIDNVSAMHIGYGATLGVGCRVTKNLSLGLYSGVLQLSGNSIDGIERHYHSANLIWETGVKVSWTFNKRKQ